MNSEGRKKLNFVKIRRHNFFQKELISKEKFAGKIIIFILWRTNVEHTLDKGEWDKSESSSDLINFL